ncbi:hypothetical protein [Streptomyces sp. NPDC057854]|uniref:hypothetical protein n=1 Tax=unclassified Streptomyces TaxID=2593676 RepID=UPI0036AA245A
MSAKPRPLLSWRLRPAARAALAWCGAIAYPFALFFAARGTPFDSPGLPFVSAAAVTVLPLGLLRRRPLPALTLMLLGTYVTATTTPFLQVVYLLILANDLAAGYVVATRPRLIAVTAAVTTLGVQVAFAARLGTGTDGFARTVAVLVLALAAAWMTGHSRAVSPPGGAGGSDVGVTRGRSRGPALRAEPREFTQVRPPLSTQPPRVICQGTTAICTL